MLRYSDCGGFMIRLFPIYLVGLCGVMVCAPKAHKQVIDQTLVFEEFDKDMRYVQREIISIRVER